MAKNDKKDILADIQMSDEEKKKFAEDMMKGPMNAIRAHRKSIISNHIGTPIATVGGIILAKFFLGFGFQYFLPIFLAGMAISYASTWLSSRLAIKRILKYYSAGRVNYKQYKQLIKGEKLAQWLSLDTSKSSSAQENVATTSPNNGTTEGVTLSAEEIAVLKKLMDKNIINSVNVSVNPSQEPKKQEQQPVEQVKNPDEGRNS